MGVENSSGFELTVTQLSNNVVKGTVASENPFAPCAHGATKVVELQNTAQDRQEEDLHDLRSPLEETCPRP